MTAYRCRHCRKTVERDSEKAWIKSYCSTTGLTVRLVRQDGADR
jgi:DNA-directed RNA polymerase subunit RPC12/RpoP